MGTPGTYRAADRAYVDFPTAIAAWTAAAVPILERVAEIYNIYHHIPGTGPTSAGYNWNSHPCTAHELDRTSTRGDIARITPQRSADDLCPVRPFRWHGGGCYGQAVIENYKCELPHDLDMHAVEERLRCYRHFGTILSRDGGRPELTP